MAEGNIEADPLFVGLTRPPIFLGVPQTFFVVNAMACAVLFINFDVKLNAMVAAVLIHFAGYMMTLKEPRFMDLFIIKSQKCNRCKNKLFHGANSYDPY